MDAFIVNLIEQLGYTGLAILMALENVFPPMPSEAIMGASALAIEHGRMSLALVLLFGTAGTVLGNVFWFWIGRRLGYERLRPFIDRYGRWLTMEWEDVERAVTFFQKHGHWAVMALRATPVMRTLISLPAGLAHMGTVKFIAFTAIGAAAWNALLIGATLALVRNFGNIENIVSWTIIAILVLSVVAYLWRLAVWKPRARR